MLNGETHSSRVKDVLCEEKSTRNYPIWEEKDAIKNEIENKGLTKVSEIQVMMTMKP